jgi:hypothetical protein
MSDSNGVDVTKIPENHLLEHLGKADWVIALPEGLPSLTITDQQMMKQVKQFWELHFPDLMSIRIEMPLFREMGLEKRIAEVLADADPEIVRMMADVSIPGQYSNTVRERIQEIARRARI